MSIHIHTHTYTYIHTDIQDAERQLAITYNQLGIELYQAKEYTKHTHIHTQIHTYIHTHTHTYTHTYRMLSASLQSHTIN